MMLRETQVTALMAAILRSQARHTAAEAIREAEQIHAKVTARAAARRVKTAKRKE